MMLPHNVKADGAQESANPVAEPNVPAGGEPEKVQEWQPEPAQPSKTNYLVIATITLAVIAIVLASVSLVQNKAANLTIKQLQSGNLALQALISKTQQAEQADAGEISQANSLIQQVGSKADTKYNKYDEYINTVFPDQIKQIPQLEEKLSTTSSKLFDLANDLKTNKVDKVTFTQTQQKLELLVKLAKHQDSILRAMYNASESTNTTTDGN
jgi:hypothetical protein